MKTMIVAGNWKMNGGPDEAGSLALTIAAGSAVAPFTRNGGRVIVCPPFVSLDVVLTRVADSPISVGAQNCHWEASGAYTGEISPAMLKGMGCDHVIVGHSERRRDQYESDELIGRKAAAALAAGLTPIICVGESLSERESGETLAVITGQVDRVVQSASVDVVSRSILAYEPVWAIGTGLAATPAQAQEVHAEIRLRLREHHGIDVPILYGGSVTDQNAEELFSEPDINGALVGGAALKPAAFNSIIAAANVCMGRL